MRTALIIVILAIATAAEAKIGDMKPALDVKYGKPVNRGYHSRESSKSTADEADYKYNGMSVHVRFAGGKSIEETFRCSSAITQEMRLKLLEMHEGNSEWVLKVKERPGFTVVDGRRDGRKTVKTENAEYISKDGTMKAEFRGQTAYFSLTGK